MKTVGNGDIIAKRSLVGIRSEQVQIPDPARFVHLQFRRFAGCPFCNLHLRSFVQRHDDICVAGIREVAVFHSSLNTMQSQHGEVPFAVIADPEKNLYKEFGVESSLRSILDPRAWVHGIRGIFARRPGIPGEGEDLLGLPADFLIATDGRIVAHKYGKHAYDQWSVSDLLDLVRRNAS